MSASCDRKALPPSAGPASDQPFFAAPVSATAPGCTCPATPAAIVAIVLEIAADAVATIGVPALADTLAVEARATKAARVAAEAAVLVGFQETATGVTTGQTLGTNLRATAAVIGVRREIGADSAATAFLGTLATGLADKSAAASQAGPLLAADPNAEQRASEQPQRTTTRRQLAKTTRQVIEPPVMHADSS